MTASSPSTDNTNLYRALTFLDGKYNCTPEYSLVHEEFSTLIEEIRRVCITHPFNMWLLCTKNQNNFKYVFPVIDPITKKARDLQGACKNMGFALAAKVIQWGIGHDNIKDPALLELDRRALDLGGSTADIDDTESQVDPQQQPSTPDRTSEEGNQRHKRKRASKSSKDGMAISLLLLSNLLY